MFLLFCFQITRMEILAVKIRRKLLYWYCLHRCK